MRSLHARRGKPTQAKQERALRHTALHSLAQRSAAQQAQRSAHRKEVQHGQRVVQVAQSVHKGGVAAPVWGEAGHSVSVMAALVHGVAGQRAHERGVGDRSLASGAACAQSSAGVRKEQPAAPAQAARWPQACRPPSCALCAPLHAPAPAPGAPLTARARGGPAGRWACAPPGAPPGRRSSWPAPAAPSSRTHTAPCGLGAPRQAGLSGG